MLCGAGRRIINPGEGVYVSCYGEPGPNEGMYDDITVSSLYLNDGAQEAFLLNWDLSGLRRGMLDDFRAAVSEKTSVPVDRIYSTCTHTHSAPVLSAARRSGSDRAVHEEYCARLRDWAVEASREARENAEECDLFYNYDYVDLNISRRFITPDRKCYVVPRNKVFAGLAKEYVEKELGIIAFRRRGAGNRYKAIITNYSTHPVCVGNTSYRISADYQGYLRRAVEKCFGGVVCFATTGAAGDVHPRYPEGGIDFAKTMGTELARTAIARVYDAVKVTYDDTLRLAYCDVELPARDEKTVALYPEKAQYARGTDGGDAAPIKTRYAILGIGPILLYGVPGEVVSKLGAMVKWSSRFLRSYLLYNSTDSIGYIPIANQYPWGGWESIRCRLAAGAGEKLIRAVIEKQDELFDENPVPYPIIDLALNRLDTKPS